MSLLTYCMNILMKPHDAFDGFIIDHEPCECAHYRGSQ